MMFTYKELIDLAIGSPESGHVNFYALQVLLTCFAQRLEVLDEVVEQDDYVLANLSMQSSLLTLGMGSMVRLGAGADAEEEAPAEPANEAPVEEVPPPPTEEEEGGAEDNIPEEEGKAGENVPEEEGKAGENVLEEEGKAEENVPEEEGKEGENIPEETAGENIPEETPGDLKAAESGVTQQPEPTPAPANVETEGQKTEPADGASLPKEASSLLSSRLSTKERPGRESLVVNNVMRQEKRLSKVELQMEQASNEMKQFVGNFTTQMQLTMELVNNVAHMLIDRKPDPQRAKVIRIFAKQMKVLMVKPDRELSISWSSDEIDGGEGAEGEEEDLVVEELEAESSSAPTVVVALDEDADSDSVRPRGLDRMHTDILDLKNQFCALTNQVNELSAALVTQDCQRLKGAINELQEAMRELYGFKSSMRETTSTMMRRLNEAVTQTEFLKSASALLDEVKSDRNEVELLLAEKVNFQQLATKVSLEQLEDYKVGLEKTFCEVRNIVSGNERNILQIIDNLRMSLGIDAMELGLKDFRELIERKVQMIAEALKSYMDMTNDDCAAAAGRVKVMQDLACLSCDSTCVMRTVERSKVPSLPKAKSSVGLGPIVAFELGQIRDSGVMGYYCKDQYPHTPHAWTKGTNVPMINCAGRHAGGVHTIHTAEEHLQKVVLSKKNSGWT